MELSPEVHTFSAQLDCRYVLHVPSGPKVHDIIVLALHGYGMNAHTMLRLTVNLVGPQYVVAALEAPYQHYDQLGAPGATSAYNWGIRDHWQSAVRLHHEMVQHTLASLEQRFRIPRDRSLLIGFSQPVGLNYRFAGTHPEQVGAVLGICGGVPRDWEERPYKHIKSPILHISRDQDEFYPTETVLKFPERLRVHAQNVEFHLLPGKHRFPSKAADLVRAWMDRVFGEQTAAMVH